MSDKLSDMALVAQAMLGSHRAFEGLVERYQSPVRRFLLRLCDGDRMQADDLAQETFLKAYISIRSFRNLSGFSSWIFRIAYNVFYDYIRSRKPTDDLESVGENEWVSTGESRKDCEMDVEQALKRLDTEVRTAVVLFYMEDRKVEEVAEVMGCPSGTVKTYLYRGRKMMSEFLTQSGYGTVDR